MQNKKDKVWKDILKSIEGKISSQVSKTWFKLTRIKNIEPGKILIEAPNEFVETWIKEKYYSFLKEKLSSLLGEEVEIEFTFKEERAKFKKIQALPSPPFASPLDPKFQFENFVVGDGNRLTYAASLAVAQSPSQRYNPLFIYGGVGLGKTHLLQAIGNYILKHKKNILFCYLSCEQFTNELILAIQEGKTNQFRKKYRGVDILLMDDIQFLAGKERTQEEFFHTFNSLYQVHKQIVLSSDRPPWEIPTLEQRLRSRFEWGLITDIQPPDLETRVAILKKKAEMENIKLPDDVAMYIAERIKVNIRKLEGCLARLILYSSMVEKKEININLAKEVLKNYLPPEEQEPITSALIQEVVSKYFKIKEGTLRGKKRVKTISFPRQIAMYLTRELTDASFPDIGREFGGKDHTTVIHAYNKIKECLSKDPELKKKIKELRELITKRRFGS